MTRKVAVFIGRFQLFHNGHKKVIDTALKNFDKVLILIGSSDLPRSSRNPFTFNEREDMIYSVYDYNHKLDIIKLKDYPYNDTLWITEVNNIVNSFTNNTDEITLIGHSKDHSSYYLKLFPQWKSFEVENYENLNSTDLRTAYFVDYRRDIYIVNNVPLKITKFLMDFRRTEQFKYIQEETQFIKKYKEQWSNSPYPPVFVTVDAVVIQSGHVLLIQRKAAPGMGLWALPGGFINQNERIQDAVFRELKEETRIDVPEKVLRGCISRKEVYDDPNRSDRGRTITHAFLIKLENQTKLPKVKGSDDAVNAKWFPLSEVKSDMMFEDHYGILTHITEVTI